MKNFVFLFLVFVLFFPHLGTASGVGYCDKFCQVRASDAIVVGTVNEIVERGEKQTTYRVAVERAIKGRVSSQAVLVSAYHVADDMAYRNEQGEIIGYVSGPSWIHHVFEPGEKVGLMLQRRAISTEEYSEVYELNPAQVSTNPAEVEDALYQYLFLRYGRPIWVMLVVLFIASFPTLVVSAVGRRIRPQSMRWRKVFRFALIIFLSVVIAMLMINLLGLWLGVYG